MWETHKTWNRRKESGLENAYIMLTVVVCECVFVVYLVPVGILGTFIL